MNLGLCLLLFNKPADALKIFNKALEIDPSNIVIYQYKGNCLEQLKRYDEALKCYNKSIGAD